MAIVRNFLEIELWKNCFPGSSLRSLNGGYLHNYKFWGDSFSEHSEFKCKNFKWNFLFNTSGRISFVSGLTIITPNPDQLNPTNCFESPTMTLVPEFPLHFVKF